MSRKELSNYVEQVVGVSHCEFNDNSSIAPIGFLPPDYYIHVPCGKCIECRKKHRLSWSLRLMHECECHKENAFVTLTLDDDNLEKFQKDPKRPLMLYIDRLRKEIGYRPKYWFISELGEENNRLHYHGIIFGVSKEKLPFETLHGKWPYGFSWVGSFANIRTANYVTKYLLKQQDYKPFILCSNGIGKNYVNKSHFNWHLNGFDYRPYVCYHGAYYPLPKYYSDKMFNDDIKLCLMLNREQQERWYLRGVEYRNYRDYFFARDSWYRKTLRMGISQSLKKVKNYGKLYFSETRNCEAETFQSGFDAFEGYDLFAGNVGAYPYEGYAAR